jgi:hypothetical protein
MFFARAPFLTHEAGGSVTVAGIACAGVARDGERWGSLSAAPGIRPAPVCGVWGGLDQRAHLNKKIRFCSGRKLLRLYPPIF